MAVWPLPERICSPISVQTGTPLSTMARNTDQVDGSRRVWRESAVNSLVGRRMVKKQQMRWSQSGAHLMLQVRAAMMNGDLRQRLREQPHISGLPVASFLQPIPPLFRAA